MDLNNENITRVKKGDTPEDRLYSDAPLVEDEARHELDSRANVEIHSKLLSFYRQELQRQGSNRWEQAKDAAYYDGDQWTEEEKEILRERGQAPIAYNVIAQTVNWVIGSEKRGRTDFKILPRGKEDAKPAESKTKFLKYLSDVNRDPFHRSRAFEDTVKVGVGWIERGAQDEDDAEQIYCRWESWRNMLWDSAFVDIAGKDMRYMFRTRWVDVDIAYTWFPDREGMIEDAGTTATTVGSYDLLDGDMAMDQAENERESSVGAQVGGMDYKRSRVRLIEAWYRQPEMVKKLSGGMFHGEDYDDENEEHKASVAAGQARINRKSGMKVYVAVMTTDGLLYNGPTPYKHNRFPFTPVWAYRRDDNGLPYGMIRQLRDIQDDINKRASKALAILSSNKVIMEEGSLAEGWTMDDFADEVAKPNAILVVKPNKRVELAVDRDLAPAHLELMSRNISMVQQVGGITDEQMGRGTNATSGKAILARQDQGSMSVATIFDNLRLAVQLDGEICLSLVEQFVTEEKEFRITNQRGTPDFVTMNNGLPENDITRTKADFVIGEADWRTTMRQAASEQFADMIAKMPPEVAMAIMDLFVEGQDIENRDEIVKRIRQLNGQRDPDQTEPTPEEQQAMKANAAARAQQQQMQQIQMKAEANKADKTAAETQAIVAKADQARAAIELTKAQTIAAAMTGAMDAMTAATAVITMPTIASVADGLLKQAGWVGTPVPADMAAQGVAMQPQPQVPQLQPAPDELAQTAQPGPEIQQQAPPM